MARRAIVYLLLAAAMGISASAAGATLNVQDRTYFVVGRCDHPTYSVRLALGPVPGRTSMEGLSVLFGADASGFGYQFQAGRQGWRLQSRTAQGTRELAAGRESSFPGPGPVDLVIKRRSWLLTIALDGRILAEVADADHFDGQVAVDSALSGPAGEPIVQAVAGLLFEDTFMRPEDGLTLGQWTADSGTWRLHSVREDADNARGRGRDREPQSERSSNPFCVTASADGKGLMTTGYWFWDDYDAQVAVRNDGVLATGLAFDVAGPDDMFLLRWEAVGDIPEATPIRLLHVKNGRERELACAWVNGQRGQWYRLGVRTCGERIRAYLDEAPILDVRSDECIGGRIGLYVQGEDNTHYAVFDDVRVRSLPAYDWDDPVWLERHMGARVGRWDVREMQRHARPASWAAVLRDRDGRLAVGHDGWPPAVVSASVTAPAAGQSVGFDIGAGGSQDGAFRVALSCDEAGPQLSVQRIQDGRPTELASCRDLLIPDKSRLALAADMTRPGELNVYADGRLCLHVAHGGEGGGALGVFASDFRGAEFDDLRVAFEREEDTERLPATELFREDAFMKHWSSPEGAWWPAEGRSDAWWHVGDFYGRSEIELPLSGRTSVIHCATEIEQDSGYCLTQERAADAAVRLRLLRLGAEVASATVDAAEAASGRFVICREAPYLWVTVEGREALSFRDPEPLPGRKVALIGVPQSQLAGLKLRRCHVKDYYFEEAPADWMRVGDWKVTNRFTCDPRWSFMAALATQNAVLFNKYAYTGDVTLEAHMGAKMGGPEVGGRYRRVGDFDLALCTEPQQLGSGYNFIVGGWDRSWSDAMTCLLKGTDCLASTTERFLPNVRREDTQQRVLRVPWISAGRDIHGAWYYIKARKQGSELSSYVDNHVAYTCTDPQPLGRFFPAVWTYDTEVVLARVKISYEQREVPGRLVQRPGPQPAPDLPTVPAPLIVSETQPGFFDDFEGGHRGWHTYEGQQSAVLDIVAGAGATGRHCLRVTNAGGGGLFEAIAPLGEARIRPAYVPNIGFRYRVPPDARLNLYLKVEGQYYYVHMTGPDEDNAFYRRLGELPLQADGAWHEARFPLAAAYRALDGPAAGMLESAVFGNLHRGLEQAGIGGNGAGLAYYIDDFKLASTGSADFRAVCRRDDVPGGAVVLGVIDSWAPTVPGSEKPLARESLTDGEWFCHARVRQEDGTLSAVAHLPFVVATRPLTAASVEPQDGAPWDMGPVELQFGSEGAPLLDASSLRLSVNGKKVQQVPGLFEVDWLKNRLRIDLARAGLEFADGETCALDLDYADGAQRGASFRATLVAAVAADVTPPTAVVLEGYLPAEDFESEGLDWEGSRDTALLRDSSTAASGAYSLKVQNLRWASAFTTFVRRGGLGAGAYPLVEFDCRAPAGVQFDLVTHGRQGDATIGLSDACQYGTYLGKASGFAPDDRWNHCEFDLLDGLKMLPYARGVFDQSWLALGDFGYRANAVGAYFNLDNFRFVPLVNGRRPLALKWRAHDAGGIGGYSYKWSALPADSPDDVVDTTEPGGEFSGLPVPDAYLHVKACDRAGNWGPVRSFRFRVDDAAPAFVRASPAPDARSADSTVSVVVRDDGSAVDPEAVVLSINGRPYRPHSPGVTYDLKRGELVWRWVEGRPPEERSIPDGSPVQVELAAADFAGNAIPARRWQWVMDYSQDREPPTMPVVRPVSARVGAIEDFEDGLGSWSTKRTGPRGADIRCVPHPVSGVGHCLELYATGDRVSFNAVATATDYDLGQNPLVCFDYCMPGSVSVDMQVQVNNAWYTVKMTAQSPVFRQIGVVPNVRADNSWHHVCVDLLDMVQKAAPGASAYTVNTIEFGDSNRNANNRNSRWFIDDFMLGGYGPPEAELTWRAEDITGVAGYSVVFDREMHTIPPREVTTAEESGRFHADEPGTYWLHVTAYDGNGNWSPPRHLAYEVKMPPAPEPEATAPAAVP